MSDEFDQADELEQLRAAHRRLQAQFIRAKAKTEDLVEATITAAHDAMISLGKIPPIPTPKLDKRTHSPEVALWHLTDWQGSKLTSSYNTEIMSKRVLGFADVAQRITEIHRADHPVRECLIGFGGDMVEGLFNFPTQPYEVDETIFGQYVAVARLLVEVVRRALGLYEKATVIAEWGNHGRIGSKRSAVPRADNFDRMTYELARQLLAGEERLTWQDCPEDIQRIEVGNYRALLIHGDEVGRSGFASPMTMVQHIAKWQSGAYPWEFRDCYVGHYHVHQEFGLPNGLGAAYYTGSAESDNRYALTTMASSAAPSQRLNFIDPKRGRVTSCHKIWL